jgi:hypothetical protein
VRRRATSSVKGMDARGDGYWVGESKSIKVSAPSASSERPDLARKVGGMCVISNELLADTSARVREQLVRDSLAEALALTRRHDVLLGDGGGLRRVAGRHPERSLADRDGRHRRGGGARAHQRALRRVHLGEERFGGLKLVMSPGTAKALGLLVNALGQSEFPGWASTAARCWATRS